MASRRADRREDLISDLVQLDGQDQLTEPELLASLIVMFNAGFRTTANMFGNGLALLIEHPEVLAALRADPSLAPSCIEEILRYEPPLHFAVRFAARDTEISGVPVTAGQSVLVLMGAANRDPRRFPDPDTFDPGRSDNHHLTFSAGPHYCLGAALGRMEGRLALPRLLGRFPALALAAEPGERRQLMLRGYDHLLARTEARLGDALAGARICDLCCGEGYVGQPHRGLIDQPFRNLHTPRRSDFARRRACMAEKQP